MAFIIRVPSITETINGNELALTVGGVRAYNKENLYSKKSVEKFQVFIGFQNMVCCNLCISTDGMQSEMRVGSVNELAVKVQELIANYDAEKHLKEMLALTDYSLTEKQFAQLVGSSNGKKVVITETGWPSEGEGLNGALPSYENAIKYFINTQNWSAEDDVDIFYFSSFDESWKVGAEGLVGAYWGLWDKDERLKFSY